jgi:MFS family permease
VGPFLPGLLGLGPVAANGVASAALCIGLALTFSPQLGRLRATPEGQVPMSLLAAWRFRPGLAWAAVVGGVFEVGLGSITTAYGSQIGLELGVATSIAGALGFGSFLLQYPIGWLADHHPPRRLFLAGAALLTLSALAFMAAGQAPWLLWVCAATWGAVGGALYTLSMIRVAHDFADRSALAGTSAMIAGYTAGGALGPVLSGWIFDHLGVSGQGLWLAVLALSLAAVQGLRRG